MSSSVLTVKKNINAVLEAQRSVHDIADRLQLNIDSLTILCDRLANVICDKETCVYPCEKRHTNEPLGK
jgi:hypothetical protein